MSKDEQNSILKFVATHPLAEKLLYHRFNGIKSNAIKCMTSYCYKSRDKNNSNLLLCKAAN